MTTTKDFSVKFGRDPHMGLDGEKCFPFLYTLVNHNESEWTPVTSWDYTSQPDVSTYTVLCKANAKTPWYVRLDPDYNFKLLRIKYEAMRWVPRVEPNGSSGHSGYFTPYDLPPSGNDENQFNTYLDPGVDYQGTRLSRYIGVTLSFQGSGSQILYGGFNTNPLTNGQDRIPLHLEAIQGHEYGHFAIRTPYLLPREAVLSFEFTNSLPVSGTYNDLYVSAVIAGVKIRL